MNQIYLLLGSNLGDCEQTLRAAQNYLESEVGTILQTSAIYRTAPWGNPHQPAFLNQSIGLSSLLSPQQLLAEVLKIESQLGRKRTEKWGPRTIDIDILFYADQCINEPDLVIPHPYVHQRHFALRPLLDIAPHFRHPGLNKTIAELYHSLPDQEYSV